MIVLNLFGETVNIFRTHTELEELVMSSNMSDMVKHDIVSLIDWHEEQSKGSNDNQIIGQSTII